MSTDLTVNDSPGLLVVKEKSRLDDSLFSKELAPHYMQLSKQLASSELVPKSFRGKPQDLFIAWAMGYQVGLTPEQSMQCIAVINGKPAMWGDDMLALCMAHKEFDDIIEQPIQNKDGAITGYTCEVKRKGKAPKVNIFTLDMAKRAGLLGKGGVWTQYPERMLKLRARGFSLRDAFPDALKGIKPREEVEDYIEADYKVVEGSRTEFLKRDLLTKKDSNEEKDIESFRSFENVESEPVADEAEQGEQLSALDGAGREEDKAHHSDRKDAPVNPAKCKEIMQLFKNKMLTDERIEKAFQYYEVESIAELTEEQADNLIEKLKKS